MNRIFLAIFIGVIFLCPLTRLCGMHSSTPYALLSKNTASKVAKKSVAPLVVLDPGHGGVDEGAKVRQLQEKRIALLTALYAKKHLEELGYRVILTRTKDAYISLPRRVDMANKAKGALFLSIHFNSAKNTLAEGVEIFYYRDRQERMTLSQKLASCVLDGILWETQAVSRGVKSGNFHVIRETQMPAVIVEAGFMTNYNEWTFLRKKSYLDRIAKGIALGVDRYFKP